MTPEREVTIPTPRGPVRVEMEPALSRAARASEADHVRFLADHAAELAAAAWDGFERHGAGAVVLWREPQARRLWARRRPFEPERLWYATVLHTLPGMAEVDFDGWVAALLDRYDPRAESVVVFAGDGPARGYRIAGTSAPPDALLVARATLN